MSTGTLLFRPTLDDASEQEYPLFGWVLGYRRLLIRRARAGSGRSSWTNRYSFCCPRCRVVTARHWVTGPMNRLAALSAIKCSSVEPTDNSHSSLVAGEHRPHTILRSVPTKFIRDGDSISSKNRSAQRSHPRWLCRISRRSRHRLRIPQRMVA